jgi:large subunit ribosomal protein L17
MRSLARALVMEGRIMTTEPRAKELRPYIEKMITRAKTGNITDIRILHLTWADSWMLLRN